MAEDVQNLESVRGWRLPAAGLRRRRDRLLGSLCRHRGSRALPELVSGGCRRSARHPGTGHFRLCHRKAGFEYTVAVKKKPVGHLRDEIDPIGSPAIIPGGARSTAGARWHDHAEYFAQIAQTCPRTDTPSPEVPPSPSADIEGRYRAGAWSNLHAVESRNPAAIPAAPPHGGADGVRFGRRDVNSFAPPIFAQSFGDRLHERNRCTERNRCPPNL